MLNDLNQKTCPWWLCPTFDNPLRRLLQPPQSILGDLIQPGWQVADLGCGMGYFTIPMAGLVGPAGRVYALDLQPQMLQLVERRARRAGVLPRLALLRCMPDQLNLPEGLDFALAFWMLHEVRDPAGFLIQLRQALKPGAGFLLVEPRLHVSAAAFERACRLAAGQGFTARTTRAVAISRAVLFTRS